MPDDDTILDLYRVPDHGKAELVRGRLVLIPSTGAVPGRAAGRIYRSLDDHEKSIGGGYAFPDNVGFLVDLPHRRSFSLGGAFWVGELPSGGQLLEGAHIFAVEVRSKTDYGADAELLMAAKRTDYFAAGTLVVWDVDVLRNQEIRAYRASRPHQPDVFRRGQHADAEPALPRLVVSVEELLAHVMSRCLLMPLNSFLSRSPFASIGNSLNKRTRSLLSASDAFPASSEKS
jgi:Uma2 family endonuclease